MKFSKMNGLGNDYIYINLMQEDGVNNYSELAKRLSDRNFGIGGDGLVLIDRSEVADFSMRMFNADGSEGEMCGNAIRCVAKYVYDNGLTNKKVITVSTLAGIKTLEIFVLNGKADTIRVNMGKPSLNTNEIPVQYLGDKFINQPITTSKGIKHITCVSVGNPHAVIFIDSDDEADMELGKEISENTALFPRRINVEFIKVIDKQNAFMRVYERGAGETLACGTGACASFYAGYIQNKLNHKANIHLKGGTLQIEIIDDKIYMNGKAELNYEGEIFL